MKKHIFCRHSTEIQVPFFDVDAMFIVWHGHYIKYFEIARCDLLEKIHYTYNDIRNDGYAFPIVKLDLKYIKPARFGQWIRIDMAVVNIDTCLRIDYTIVDKETGIKLTRGSTTQAVVQLSTGELQFQTPEKLIQAMQQLPDFQAA